jgi:hypothetical protein
MVDLRLNLAITMVFTFHLRCQEIALGGPVYFIFICTQDALCGGINNKKRQNVRLPNENKIDHTPSIDSVNMPESHLHNPHLVLVLWTDRHLQPESASRGAHIFRISISAGTQIGFPAQSSVLRTGMTA